MSRLPEFPIDSFPIPLRDYCEAVSEATQTPLELAAMSMLGALSTVSLGAQVDAGNGWTEELGLYVMVVMAAAERKSTVLRIVTRPLRDIEAQTREQERAELQEERSRKAVFEHRRRHLLQKYGKTEGDEERNELWQEIKDADNQLAMFGELPSYRLLADDVTAEGLTRLLALHGSMGILSAEGSAIDNIVGGRYSDGNAKLDIILKAYAGEPHTVDRRGRESEHAERPLLAIMLAIQEDYLAGLIDHSRSRSLGLVSRFVFVTPRSRVGQRDVEPQPVPEYLADIWRDTLTRIHQNVFKENRCQNRQKEGFGVSGVFGVNKGVENTLSLSLSSEAREQLRGRERTLEQWVGPGGELAHVADWAGRHLGRVLRIAGLLHLADKKTAADPIDEHTLYRAEDIGGFLMAHGRNAFEEPDTAALRAGQVLEQWATDTITMRDLYRQVFHARGKVDQARRLAGELIERGFLEEVPVERGKPGRPSPTYKINLNGAVHAHRSGPF